MMNLQDMRAASTLLLALILGACTEDEQSCLERISADFDRTAELANKSGHHERALIARESALAAAVIFSDDDRNVCDYVTADVYLQRK
jgi:hypothetical protein